MSCALRINPATRSTSITFGEGQQNRAGEASPLRLLLQGRCAVLCGGGFPLTPPHPPGGHVKQKHARTRSYYHPRPMKPHVHENIAAVCILPRPLDRVAAGGGNTQKSQKQKQTRS